MVIVDTSVRVEVLRHAEKAAPGTDDPWLTRFTRMELLMGAGREDQWRRLERYLDGQLYAEPEQDTWRRAATTYFGLRRSGKTVRSPINCCIGEIAMAHDAQRLHRDRDFSVIATVRPLKQRWLEL